MYKCIKESERENIPELSMKFHVNQWGLEVLSPHLYKLPLHCVPLRGNFIGEYLWITAIGMDISIIHSVSFIISVTTNLGAVCAILIFWISSREGTEAWSLKGFL